MYGLHGEIEQDNAEDQEPQRVMDIADGQPGQEQNDKRDTGCFLPKAPIGEFTCTGSGHCSGRSCETECTYKRMRQGQWRAT
ncbi:hypothetical protein D3C74_438770 [compost metagenome]